MGLATVGALAAASIPGYLIWVLVDRDGTRDALLALLQLAVWFGAGYFAGRMARRNPLLHGGFAGLAAFTLGAAIALSGGQQAGVLQFLIGGLLAMLLGTAGAVLAGPRRSQEPDPG